jgi:phenylalanyl-tRNA synthetase beta chain
MKISRDWLQTYFEKPLPDAEKLAEALTFHVFEIESIDNEILDVKVTPDRGHDCLSYRGIAKELSAILRLSLEADPLRTPLSLEPKTDMVAVEIKEPRFCPRYIAVYIRGVKVAPSPGWLQEALQSMGQKSVNNVVDATNYVMFGLGQPLHAFDAGQLRAEDGVYALGVRRAKKGETLFALDDKEYRLGENDFVITDDNADAIVGIAGVKGGKPAGITQETNNIVLEAANFDGATVRKTSQSLKLRTDASERFQHGLSPELAAYGARAAADLIVQLAGGKIVGFADEYVRPQEPRGVAVTLSKVNAVLGTALRMEDVADVWARLDFRNEREADTFTVSIPFERLDLQSPEDLVEEVGRIIGYDEVPTTELPEFPQKPALNKNFIAAEHVRESLIAQGYSEVYTTIFADKGERAVANKVDSVRPFLRTTLVDGLKEAYEKNVRNKDLLGLTIVRMFEIGIVWHDGKEVMMLGLADEKGVRESPLPPYDASAYEMLPLTTAVRFQSFSKFPFITRDVSLWVPTGTAADDVLTVIRAHAGDLVVRSEKFDEYRNEKTGKTSYAFRLVFQTFDRTLTDKDANSRMDSVCAALKERGWEVR